MTKPEIIYTHTDEAPALATYSFLMMAGKADNSKLRERAQAAYDRLIELQKGTAVA